MKQSKTLYYHFTGATLRNGEPIPRKGVWLKHNGDVVPCDSGLHASPTPFDALQYAPGEMLHQVELRGSIVPHGEPVDKFAASERKIVATINCTPILRLFARRVALDVIHLWDAPQIVREYLETGDESKRDAAGDAARAAAWAAWAAARAAAWAARDARAAAGDAARDARAAAGEEKQKLYRQWFNEMVQAEFALRKATK